MSEVDKRRLEILDECLSQIQTGAASVSDCLKAYPKHHQYLKSNLEIALYTRDLLAPAKPRDVFRSQTRIRIMNQIQTKRSVSRTTRTDKPKRRIRFLRPSFAYITLLLAFILSASGLGVVGASASALPGDLLYNIKLGIEDTRLAFSQDAASDAELLILFADRRIEEVVALTDARRVADIELALTEYDDLISQIIGLTDEESLTEEPETLDKIHFGLEHHQEILKRVLEKAPPAAIKGLENALERSGHGKEKIEQIKNGTSPSDHAPGQQDKDKDKENESGNQGNPPEDRGGGNDPDRTPGPPPTKTPKPKD